MQKDLEQSIWEKTVGYIQKKIRSPYEHPDPTPMAPPLGYKKQPSMVDTIRDMIRSEKLKQAAEEAGLETLEEADDFDVGDDFDPVSPYEHNFDPPQDAPEPPPQPPAAKEGAEGGGSPKAPQPPAPGSTEPPKSE